MSSHLNESMDADSAASGSSTQRAESPQPNPPRDDDNAAPPPRNSQEARYRARCASPFPNTANAGQGFPARPVMSTSLLWEQLSALSGAMIVFDCRQTGPPKTAWGLFVGRLKLVSAGAGEVRPSYTVTLSSAYNYMAGVTPFEDGERSVPMPSDGYEYRRIVEASVHLQETAAKGLARQAEEAAATQAAALERQAKAAREAMLEQAASATATQTAALERQAEDAYAALNQQAKQAHAAIDERTAEAQALREAHALAEQEAAKSRAEVNAMRQQIERGNAELTRLKAAAANSSAPQTSAFVPVGSAPVAAPAVPVQPAPAPIAEFFSPEEAAEATTVLAWRALGDDDVPEDVMHLDGGRLSSGLHARYVAGNSRLPGGDQLVSAFETLRDWVIVAEELVEWTKVGAFVRLGERLLKDLRIQFFFVVDGVRRADLVSGLKQRGMKAAAEDELGALASQLRQKGKPATGRAKVRAKGGRGGGGGNGAAKSSGPGNGRAGAQ